MNQHNSSASGETAHSTAAAVSKARWARDGSSTSKATTFPRVAQFTGCAWWGTCWRRRCLTRLIWLDFRLDLRLCWNIPVFLVVVETANTLDVIWGAVLRRFVSEAWVGIAVTMVIQLDMTKPTRAVTRRRRMLEIKSLDNCWPWDQEWEGYTLLSVWRNVSTKMGISSIFAVTGLLAYLYIPTMAGQIQSSGLILCFKAYVFCRWWISGDCAKGKK